MKRLKNMKSKIKSLNWEKLQKILTVIAMLIGGGFALYQFHVSNQIESARLMIDFNNQLRNGEHSYSKLIAAIGNNKPIIEPNGEYTEIDIDNYLVMWELLNNIYENRLITEDMLYDAFSYDIEKTYCNKEIQQYISRTRKEGEDLYMGFRDLANNILKADKTSCKKING